MKVRPYGEVDGRERDGACRTEHLRYVIGNFDVTADDLNHTRYYGWIESASLGFT